MTRAALGGSTALAMGLALAWTASQASRQAPQTLPAKPTASPMPGEDSVGDGTPDFLRLTDQADRRAFVNWFTYLAEWQFFRTPGELPAEVADCAALVRFAYRESLRRHDGAWAAQIGLADAPPLGSIAKYHYPFTPLRAGLFRASEGPYTGAFAEFADARTLMRLNTWRVSRDLAAAEPGDLLFFHQPDQRFPFHVMIYLGDGRVRGDTGPFVVYHTGPDSHSRGEIRRPSLAELARHPNPQWRPEQGNPSFLGVYRWNILNG